MNLKFSEILYSPCCRQVILDPSRNSISTSSIHNFVNFLFDFTSRLILQQNNVNLTFLKVLTLHKSLLIKFVIPMDSLKSISWSILKRLSWEISYELCDNASVVYHCISRSTPILKPHISNSQSIEIYTAAQT